MIYFVEIRKYREIKYSFMKENVSLDELKTSIMKRYGNLNQFLRFMQLQDFKKTFYLCIDIKYMENIFNNYHKSIGAPYTITIKRTEK